MTLAPVRINALPGKATFDDGDVFSIDTTAGTKKLTGANLRAQLVGGLTGTLTYRGLIAGDAVPDTSASNGDYYVISVGGTSQGKTWGARDWAIYRGSSGAWDQVKSGTPLDVKKDFGAVGDGVIDDTDAIQAAIDFAVNSGVEAVVLLPPGIYLTSATLTIQGGCRLVGAGNVGATSYAPMKWNGTMIRYAGGVGTYAIDVSKTGNVIYQVEMHDLRVGSAGQSPKPHGIRFSKVSECKFVGLQITGGFENGLHVTGFATLFSFHNFKCESNVVGVLIESVDDPLGALDWAFSSANFYQNSEAHIKLTGNVERLRFDASWFEDAPIGLSIPAPTLGSQFVQNVIFNGCGFNHAANSNGRAFKVDAGSGSNSLSVEGFYVQNTHLYMDGGAEYAGEFLFASNAGPNSSCRGIQFHNVAIDHVSTGAVLSDSANSGFDFTGYSVCYGAVGDVKPFGSGTGRFHFSLSGLAYRDFAGAPGAGEPWRLPQGIPYDVVDGLFAYDSAQKRPFWYVGNGGADVRYCAAVNAANKLLADGFKGLVLPIFANNAAAIAGGLVFGDSYRTGGDPDLICVVH